MEEEEEEKMKEEEEEEEEAEEEEKRGQNPRKCRSQKSLTGRAMRCSLVYCSDIDTERNKKNPFFNTQNNNNSDDSNSNSTET